MTEEELLRGLNEGQSAAVRTTEGPVRLVAGAGTGKTRTLTRRYVYLVEALGIPPENILCVTFTNRAAAEMKQRVRHLIGERDTGFICTFHSLGLQLLKEEITHLGWPAGFTVLDTEDKEALLMNVFEQMGITLKEMTVKRAGDYTDGQKLDLSYAQYLVGESPEELRERIAAEKDRKRELFLRYLYEQKKIFALDFEDLVDLAVALLNREEAVRSKWQDRFEYILVDEFQDIDRMQYSLVEILSKGFGNLFVVGDPDQTIYTWRGADVRYILDFPAKFSGTQTLLLEENYRSTPEILAVANTLIRRNRQRVERTLRTSLPSGEKPLYYHAKDTSEEAAYISSRIKGLKEKGVPYESMAVLYRAHYVSRSLEDAFVREKIPYVIWGGVAFYSRKEIKDALCYLRMLVRADDLAFARTVNEPRRGVGRKRMALLKAYAAENSCTLMEALRANTEHPLIKSSAAAEYIGLIDRYKEYGGYTLSDLLRRLMSESGYIAMLKAEGDSERLDNLAELLQSVEEYEKSAGEHCELGDYLEQMALFTDRDRQDRKETVRLMTVHNAKGLEFDHVIVCGLNEGIFPSRRTDSFDAMEEERRLCYVACTRARQTLTITEAGGLSHEGAVRYPSRFIGEMGKENFVMLVPVPDSYLNAAKRNRPEPVIEKRELFSRGDRVVHPVFGAGTVTELDEAAHVCRVLFDGGGRERRITLPGPLKRLQDGR